MPRTLPAIPHFSLRPAGQAAVKALPQPLKDNTGTFASLLGVEKPVKGATASISKKLRFGAASSKTDTHDANTHDDSDNTTSGQAGTGVVTHAAITDQTNQPQLTPALAPAISLASYIPISSTEKHVSVTQSTPSVEASPALQASRPLPQPTPTQTSKGLHSGAGVTAVAAQDTQTTNSAVRSYETSGDQQVSRAPTPARSQTTTAAEVSSLATDTAPNSPKTPSTAAAASSPATDTAANSPKTSSTAAAVSSPATDTAANSPKASSTAAAVSSPATDTAANSPKTSSTAAAISSPATDTAANSPKASSTAAAVSSPATDTSAASSKTPLAPDAPTMDRAPKNPEPALPSKLTAAPNWTAKSSETPSSRNSLAAANKAPQGDNIASKANSDGLKRSISNAQSGITPEIAKPSSSADPVKTPDAAVVVRSQTHLVPKTVKAADRVVAQIATGSSSQDQAASAEQSTVPPSQRQHNSELSTSAAAPRNDVPPKIAASASAPNETDPSQTVAVAPSRTKAAASSTEQQFNSTTDGSSSADTQAEKSASAVSASRLSVTSNAGGGGTHGGSDKDAASHDHPGSGSASASAEVQRSFEVSLATPLGAAGASPATPAQQILDGIQREITSADNSQALTSTLQPTLDGQQPLKTITVALSPASLGNVAVELSYKGGQLGVKLQVQEAGTVQLLRQDDSLEKLLESAGYTVQSLSIHLSPQPSQPTQAPGQATPNGQSFSNQFSSSGSGQEQGRSQNSKGQPTNRDADQRPGYGRTEDVSGGGSLYV